MARAPRRASRRRAVSVRFRVDFGLVSSLGPGKIELLEAICATGSLSQGARGIGLSYRRAWQLIEDLNRSFRREVVAAKRGGAGGGGANVTPFGRQLIASYRSFEERVQAQAARSFARFGRVVARASGSARPGPGGRRRSLRGHIGRGAS